MKNWLLTILLLFGAVGAWAGETVHTVTPGQNLGVIAKQYDQSWKTLCAYNGLANCNVIKPGDPIRIPARQTVVKSEPRGCIDLNTAPWNRFGDPKRRLEAIDANADLTAEEKIEAKALVAAGRGERGMVTGDMVFKAMPFRSKNGTIKFLHNVRICTPEQGGRPEAMETWKLSTGKTLVDMLSCGNITFMVTAKPDPEPEKEPDPKPDPDPTPGPQPQPDPQPEPQPEPEPDPTPEPDESCPFDPKLFFGQEKEPKRAGNRANSSHAKAALYCTWRGEGGTHGVGFNFMGTWFNGLVNGGSGHFGGQMLSFGPSYEFISDDNWNLELSLLFGRLHENYGQAQLRQERTINLVGPAASLNLGQRRARGEAWFPETRLFAQYGFATSVDASVTNFLQPGDATDYSRFGSLFQAGIHADVLDAEWFTLWARAGYFRESPFSETMNLRVGVSDPYRICGVGIGMDFDLLHGGQAFGYGWWCDGMKGIRVVRAEYRLSQIVKETGATFEEDGTLFVPMPPAKPD